MSRRGKAETPRKALAPGPQRIARSEDGTGKQRADDGENGPSEAQRSEEDDNARGSTNPIRKCRGTATGNARGDTAKP
jgi:hypothetical protein